MPSVSNTHVKNQSAVKRQFQGCNGGEGRIYAGVNNDSSASALSAVATAETLNSNSAIAYTPSRSTSALSASATAETLNPNWVIAYASSRPTDSFAGLRNRTILSHPESNRARVQSDAALVAWLASQSSVERHDSSDTSGATDAFEEEACLDIGIDALDAIFATLSV